MICWAVRQRDRIRSYTYLYAKDEDAHAAADAPIYTNHDVAAARAVEYVDMGFTAVKFDPAGP